MLIVYYHTHSEISPTISLEGLSSVVELWVWGVVGSWLGALSNSLALSAGWLAGVGQESVAVWVLLLGHAWWNGGWVAVPLVGSVTWWLGLLRSGVVWDLDGLNLLIGDTGGEE